MVRGTCKMRWATLEKDGEVAPNLHWCGQQMLAQMGASFRLVLTAPHFDRNAYSVNSTTLISRDMAILVHYTQLIKLKNALETRSSCSNRGLCENQALSSRKTRNKDEVRKLERILAYCASHISAFNLL